MKLLLQYRFLFLLVFATACATSLPAQKDEGVKKSKKTEIVEGRKYYLHTVEKGQTLYAIAKAYELTVNDIIVENPDALNGIKPGQVLRIPAEKKTIVATPTDTVQYVTHTVEKGQTLYSLSVKYNVTSQVILDHNPAAKDGLKAGMVLRIPVRVIKVSTTASPDTVVKKDTVLTRFKDVYNVALMMPLQLWNVANINTDEIVGKKAEFPQKPQAAVEFYEGALLAIDSMRKTGMRINVWAYDVDDIDSGKINVILAKPEFANMDLIIGPFSPGPFDEVAEFADAHQIGIVSPVSPVNRVLFKNPTASKTVPSSSTQMEHLAAHISTERRNDNVILITSGLVKENKLCGAFRDEMNRLRALEGKDTIRTNKGFGGLESMLVKDRMNVLVIPSTSQAFVTDLLRNLYGLAERYQITVYGMPTWMEFENLDAEYMEALHLHFAAPYFVDYNAPATRNFILEYRAAYGGDPSAFAFAGFDVTLFFLQQLKLNGTGFIAKLPEQKGKGLQQDFSFVKSDAESGYENIGLRIVHISDYELVPFGVENPKPKNR